MSNAQDIGGAPRGAWWISASVVACFLISGATGLVYEIVWSRYVQQLIGSSGYAHTVTLATFMAGLGLGNHLLGRQADRWRSPLALYAWLEVGIGAYGLAFPALFVAWTALYLRVGAALGPTSPWILPLKLTLGALVMVLPATLMGGTLPALCRWLVRHQAHLGQRIGALYFINTAGAVFGCALGGFVLLEAWGLSMTMTATAWVNLIIGGALLAVARWLEPPAELEVDEEDERPDTAPSPVTDEEVPRRGAEAARSPRVVLSAFWVAGLGGALSMLYELVWIRLVGFVFGSSTWSFSVMLMTFISGMAIGGGLAAWLMRRPRPLLSALGGCQLGIAASVLVMVPFYERFPYLFALLRATVARSDTGFVMLQALQVLLLAALMLIPTTLMGMALPMATRLVTREVGSVGHDVGRVFAVNTFGTLLGASITGLALIPALGLQNTLYLGVLMSATLGLSVLAVAGRRRGLLGGAGVCALLLVLAVAWGVGRWDPILMTAGFFRRKAPPESFEAMRERYARHKLLFARDGQDMTVTVFEVDDEVFLKVNGKTDASTLREDMVTQTISGHLPVLLHPGEPRDALVIGLGSGVTAGAVLRHPDTRVTIVELSESVVEGARHFAHVNHDVLNDPRATLHIGDARDFLLLEERDEGYDVVISEPSNPWISGVANLFAVDFFEAVERNLAPDGVYVQWLQLYAFSDEAFTRSVRSLRRIFPHVTVWRFTRADALILASRQPLQSDPETLAERLNLPSIASDLGPEGPLPLQLNAEAPDVSPIALLSHQVISADAVPVVVDPQGPINTVDAPYLEFEAPRAMFRGDAPTILDAQDARREWEARRSLLIGASLDHDNLAEHPERALALAEILQRSGQTSLASALRRSADTHRAADDAAVRGSLARDEADGLLAAHVERLLEREQPPTADVCAFYADQQARRLLAMANIWLIPDTRRLQRWVLRCAERHPTLAPSLMTSVSAALYGLGDSKQALDYARRGLAAIQQLSSARRSGEHAAAERERLDLLRLMGRSALILQQRDAARSAFEEILRQNPRDPEARQVLGVTR